MKPYLMSIVVMVMCIHVWERLSEGCVLPIVQAGALCWWRYHYEIKYYFSASFVHIVYAKLDQASADTVMMKPAHEWVRTSDPVTWRQAHYLWTTARDWGFFDSAGKSDLVVLDWNLNQTEYFGMYNVTFARVVFQMRYNMIHFASSSFEY